MITKKWKHIKGRNKYNTFNIYTLVSKRRNKITMKKLKIEDEYGSLEIELNENINFINLAEELKILI